MTMVLVNGIECLCVKMCLISYEIYIKSIFLTYLEKLGVDWIKIRLEYYSNKLTCNCLTKTPILYCLQYLSFQNPNQTLITGTSSYLDKQIA